MEINFVTFYPLRRLDYNGRSPGLRLYLGKLIRFLFPSREKIPVPARQPEIARSHGLKLTNGH